ncbi:hypothetical protein QZH41_006388 [Actinostola sp. cb2023]|nr:hypothetical protein QZH41_006388 [Actinostola sp. cb2023]
MVTKVPWYLKACKDDYTCSNDWGNAETWKLTKTGNECKYPCRTFKQYFNNPINFCNSLFDRSFKYIIGIPGQDCMLLWPNDANNTANTQLAREYARKAISAGLSLTAHAVVPLLACMLGVAMFPFGLK